MNTYIQQNRYVKFEDNIIIKHCDYAGMVHINDAQRELASEGYPRTAHSIARRVNFLRRKKKLPEIIDKRGGSKPVKCLETGKRYESMISAVRDMECGSVYGISASCRDRFKTSGGYHWRLA